MTVELVGGPKDGARIPMSASPWPELRFPVPLSTGHAFTCEEDLEALAPMLPVLVYRFERPADRAPRYVFSGIR